MMNLFSWMKVSLEFSYNKISKDYFFIDEEPTAGNTDSASGKINSFFTENYDHENLTTNTAIDEEEISTRQVQRRKSVSSRFRSVSKEITYEIKIV